jgi:hypothetical protein
MSEAGSDYCKLARPPDVEASLLSALKEGDVANEIGASAQGNNRAERIDPTEPQPRWDVLLSCCWKISSARPKG